MSFVREGWLSLVHVMFTWGEGVKKWPIFVHLLNEVNKTNILLKRDRSCSTSEIETHRCTGTIGFLGSPLVPLGPLVLADSRAGSPKQRAGRRFAARSLGAR